MQARWYLVVPQCKLFHRLTQRPQRQRFGKYHQAIGSAQTASDTAPILRKQRTKWLVKSQRVQVGQGAGSKAQAVHFLAEQHPRCAHFLRNRIERFGVGSPTRLNLDAAALTPPSAARCARSASRG